MVRFGWATVRQGKAGRGAVWQATLRSGGVRSAQVWYGEDKKKEGVMESESLLDGREILVKVGEDHGDDHKRDLQRLIAEAWAKAEEKYYPQG